LDLAFSIILADAKLLAVSDCVTRANSSMPPMQRRHEYALNDLLERAACVGFAAVDKCQILLWYGQERFSVGIRRDIRSRWEDLAGEIPGMEGQALRFAETRGQILLILDKIFFGEDE
jgi:hypothetical protein